MAKIVFGSSIKWSKNMTTWVFLTGWFRVVSKCRGSKEGRAIRAPDNSLSWLYSRLPSVWLPASVGSGIHRTNPYYLIRVSLFSEAFPISSHLTPSWVHSTSSVPYRYYAGHRKLSFTQVTIDPEVFFLKGHKSRPTGWVPRVCELASCSAFIKDPRMPRASRVSGN